jgi:hypothetical protein
VLTSPRHASSCHDTGMQLRRARLCLDCEEIHEAQQCPVCASESFAYLSRWVPAPERRAKPRTTSSAPVPAPLPSRGKMVGLGIAGLGLVGLAQWLAKGRALIEKAAEGKETGELR